MIFKPMQRTYSFFQDAHMMIIGGIGYLIAFLKRYQWSAFSFNFILAAFTYQWSILVQGFIFDEKNTENDQIPTILNGTMPYWEPSKFALIRINLASILEAEFSAATCLISFCCILGIASHSQCLVMVLSETVFYKVCNNVTVTYCIIKCDVIDTNSTCCKKVISAHFIETSAYCYESTLCKNDNSR